jgi:hypothetical protein
MSVLLLRRHSTIEQAMMFLRMQKKCAPTRQDGSHIVD